MHTSSQTATDRIQAAHHATDPVGLAWLITVRWTTVLAGAGAILAGRSALQVAMPLALALPSLALWSGSNVWLMWRIRQMNPQRVVGVAGLLVCADVVLLSWILSRSGGVLNPASVFYLVQIVVSALVLGRYWTWIVAALSVAGYAALFLAPTEELRAAQGMHPEIALHLRGMWLAFALTALIIAVLVTRLVLAIERRDQALDVLRDRTARVSRAAGLATLAAGAAHELSTPLATIAVAAHELERQLSGTSDPGLQQDARLIRAETDRCRQILEAMAGRSGQPVGQTPESGTLGDIVPALRARLTGADFERLVIDLPLTLPVVWPMGVVGRALGNVVQNALQASTESTPVRVEGRRAGRGLIELTVSDRGDGMTPDQLSRAGEPFFTTKPPGIGTGLGLFVARSSVEQLGGRLSLSSVPQRGTTATITLPADVITRTTNADA